jgi:exonuclease SbcD
MVEGKKAYAQHVAERCRRLAAGFAVNTINILVAHLFVDGSEACGSERPAHVANAFAVGPSDLPRAHYIALGHIHRPQEVWNTESPCVYAGSPLQLDFGEREQQKRVVIVEAHAGARAVWESIPLQSGRKLRHVVTTIDQLPSAARDSGSDFVRVVVKTKDRIAALSQRVSAALPNAVAVQQEFEMAPPDVRPAPVQLAPRERFRRFLWEEKRIAASPEALDAFDRLYDEARHAADEA